MLRPKIQRKGFCFFVLFVYPISLLTSISVLYILMSLKMLPASELWESIINRDMIEQGFHSKLFSAQGNN
uniref:Uncharacterized protein n=1 Tax=Anguilla anguilla TaxID=7936 RepID=A0A0E9WIF9_ANGAN